MTWDHDISNKWPAARAIGPDVTPEQALDYILRTDEAFYRSQYACNDRWFCQRLKKLMNFPEGNHGEDWEYVQRFQDALGHVQLMHLGSQWIASSYVGGPDGLVSPVGTVSFAKNFGKWPSVSEVEADLELLARAFPWLSFSLWLWDSPDEAEAVTWGSDPTHAWEVASGAWHRADTKDACKGKRIPDSYSVTASVMSIISGNRKETTFPIEKIEEMWGEAFAKAHAEASI